MAADFARIESEKYAFRKFTSAAGHIVYLGEDNSMPVHLAALDGHLDVVKYFIKTLGIDKEVKGQDNKTPLINAAEGGHSEVVKYLLGIGADSEAVTSNGFTPLHMAAQKGHKDVADILIGAKANIEALTKFWSPPTKIADGHSPLVSEAREDQAVKKKTNLKATSSKRADDPSFLALPQTKKIMQSWSSDSTPSAISDNRSLLLDSIKKEKQSIDQGYSSDLGSIQGHPDVVRILIDAGANTEACGEYKDYTPLIWAAREGHPDVVKILIDAGANKDVFNQVR
ncbi:ankyrin-3-like [Ptychodera flava]|uniref:ankyrin-3-like n=1 Tax=Ptychodera flava TaxID=63121 RepID=UPI00396A8D15